MKTKMKKNQNVIGKLHQKKGHEQHHYLLHSREGYNTTPFCRDTSALQLMATGQKYHN